MRTPKKKLERAKTNDFKAPPNGPEESANRELRARLVGAFLKQQRERAGLTQQELAECLSYTTPQFISNWERGISLPPLDALPKITNLCKIPPKSLVEALYAYQEQTLKQQKKKLLALLAQATALHA